MTQPWDRKKDEPTAPYRAFLVFRGLGHGRSARKVSEMLRLQPDPDLPQVSKTTVASWAKSWDWAERAKAWDEAQLLQSGGIGEAGAVGELAPMDEGEWAARVEALRERHERLGAAMTTTALLGMEAIAAYFGDPENVREVIEGNRGKGLPALMSALRQLAETGTALDERAIGIDSMLLEWKNRGDLGAG